MTSEIYYWMKIHSHLARVNLYPIVRELWLQESFFISLSPIVKFLNSSNYANEFKNPNNWIEPPIGTCHPDKS